jgi:hypothetical protein
MRTTLLAAIAAAGIGIIGTSTAPAAPINGQVIDKAAQTTAMVDQVHCKWYPHRHRGKNPHGWGRGCGPGQKPR